MTHVFVAPHPDDVALSCGGLIASLRELGQSITILTVYSGTGDRDGDANEYQREALGFGTKALWPNTEAFNRSSILADWPSAASVPSWAADDDQLEATQTDADAAAKRFWQRSSWYRRASIRNESLAGQMVIDDLSTQGAVFTDERRRGGRRGRPDGPPPRGGRALRVLRRGAIVFLDLPDAVFRGYDDDDQLLGQPSPDDEPPFDDPPPRDRASRAAARLLPARDRWSRRPPAVPDRRHALLGLNRDWVMPGPDYAGSVVFYEDFPYAWWEDFRRVEDLPPETLANLPPDVASRRNTPT